MIHLEFTEDEHAQLIRTVKMRLKYWRHRYEKAQEQRDRSLDWLVQIQTDDEHAKMQNEWIQKSTRMIQRFEPILNKLETHDSNNN